MKRKFKKSRERSDLQGLLPTRHNLGRKPIRSWRPAASFCLRKASGGIRWGSRSRKGHFLHRPGAMSIYYTQRAFVIKTRLKRDWKTHPFPEISSRWKGRGNGQSSKMLQETRRIAKHHGKNIILTRMNFVWCNTTYCVSLCSQMLKKVTVMPPPLKVDAPPGPGHSLRVCCFHLCNRYWEILRPGDLTSSDTNNVDFFMRSRPFRVQPEVLGPSGLGLSFFLWWQIPNLITGLRWLGGEDPINRIGFGTTKKFSSPARLLVVMPPHSSVTGVMLPHNEPSNYSRNVHRCCAVIRKPGSAWLDWGHSHNGPWTYEYCFEVNVLVCWECILKCGKLFWSDVLVCW